MSNEFIYGIHAVKAVLEREPERFIEAYVLKGRQDDRLMPILNDLQVCGVSIQQMTDPHNLGACLRNADAAGAAAIIVPKDRSAPMNATVSKVACGAAEVVPLIRVTNLARTMRTLQEQGIWFVGTAGEATHDIYQAKLPGPLAIVMGAEGDGMRRLTRETCDDLIKIPMAGSVSSLNVSVASGICLFEAVRQRIAAK